MWKLINNKSEWDTFRYLFAKATYASLELLPEPKDYPCLVALTVGADNKAIQAVVRQSDARKLLEASSQERFMSQLIATQLACLSLLAEKLNVSDEEIETAVNEFRVKVTAWRKEDRQVQISEREHALLTRYFT